MSKDGKLVKAADYVITIETICIKGWWRCPQVVWSLLSRYMSTYGDLVMSTGCVVTVEDIFVRG